MATLEVFPAFFLVVGVSLLVLLAIFAWRQRSGPLDMLFGLVVALQALRLAVFTLEIVVGQETTVLALYHVRITLVGFSSVVWLLFILTYAGRKAWLSPRRYGPLFVVPLLTTLITLIPPLNSLLFTNVTFDQHGAWLAALPVIGPWLALHITYGLLLSVLSLLVLGRVMVRAAPVYRRQGWTLLGAWLLLVSAQIAIFTHLGEWVLIVAPLLIVGGAGLLAWSVYRFRLLDVSPTSAETVIASVTDGILVLDGHNRIVALNQAMIDIVKPLTLHSVGLHIDAAFADLPELLRDYGGVEHIATTITGGPEDDRRHYDLRISPLADPGAAGGRVVVLRDITDRIQGNERIRVLSRAVEQTGSIVVITDPEGVIQYVNPRFTQSSGYSPEEAIGNTPRLVKSGEHPQQFYEYFWTQIKSGKEWRGEFHNRSKDGTLYWVQATISPVLADDGTISHFVAIEEDVTAQKRIVEQERQQRQLAEALRDNAAVISSTLELDEVLERVLANASKATFVPHDVANIMLVQDGVARMARYQIHAPHLVNIEVMDGLEFVIEETPSFEYVYTSGEPLIVQDNRTFEGWVDTGMTNWVRSLLCMPIKTEGRVLGFLNLDSTEPNAFTDKDAARLEPFAAQAAIAIRNARLYGQSQEHIQRLSVLNALVRISVETQDLTELLQNLADTAGLLIGGDGCYITLWDEEHQRVSSGAAYGHLRETYHQVLPPKRGEPSMTAHVLSSGEPLIVPDAFNSDYISHRVAHSFPSRSLLALPLMTGARKLGALILAFDDPHDFTPDEVDWAKQGAELIALAIARVQAYEGLEGRNRELDSFSHTVAHDLRAPLSLVIGYMALLDEDDTLPETTLSYVREGLKAAEKMSDMIEGLLLLAQIGSTLDVIEVVDMDTVVENAVKRFYFNIEERGVTVTVQPDLPAVKGYSPWVEEVVANLISNAIKYIGQDNADPRITIRAQQQGDIVRVEVEDNGIGITPENQAVLFEMFTRFDRAEASGYGLGLSIVVRIIAHLDGDLGVESEPGKGSTFWFTLPAGDT